MSQQIKIRIADIKQMLNDGKTRADIQQHYGLSGADAKRLFAHEDLKGLRSKKVSAFVIVPDDTPSDEDITNDASSSNEASNQDLAQAPSSEEPEPTWKN